tara:strand:- start:336 stop:533 length:198 start_codon:yes stop_codon:yes gene_type:complete
MRPAEVLKQMKELKETWSKQNFRFSKEQQAEYDRLLQLRRERVKYMHDNNLVWKGPNKKTVETSK